MGRRALDLYLNVATGSLVDPSGSTDALAETPLVTYGEEVLLRLRLLKYNKETRVWDPYTELLNTDVFSSAADTDFSSLTDLLSKSTNTDINVPGDWDEMNPTEGKLSIRQNFKTLSLYQRISTNPQMGAYLEVSARPFGEDYVSGVFRFEILINNKIDKDAWITLTADTDFDATPASPTTLTMLIDHTTAIFPGTIIRFKIHDTYYYGTCESIAADLLTVSGVVFPYEDEEHEIFYDVQELIYEAMPEPIPAGYPTQEEILAWIDGKITKLEGATAGNILILSGAGGLEDSGKGFVTAIPETPTDTEVPTAKAVSTFIANYLGGGGFLKLGIGAEALEVVDNTITISASVHAIDVEGSADISSILGAENGTLLFLACHDPASAITLLHGDGNIRTRDNLDCVFTGTEKVALLKFDDLWYVLLTSTADYAKIPFATEDWVDLGTAFEESSLTITHGLNDSLVQISLFTTENIRVDVDPTIEDANTASVTIPTADIFAGTAVVRK